MSKAKYDPLEAAKVPVAGDVPEPKEDAPPAPKPAIDQRKAQAASAAPAAKIYRVLEFKKLGIWGQLVYLNVGDELSEAGYGGPDGIAKLVAQGVKLELVR